jgi:hypothetical protein
MPFKSDASRRAFFASLKNGTRKVKKGLGIYKGGKTFNFLDGKERAKAFSKMSRYGGKMSWKSLKSNLDEKVMKMEQKGGKTVDVYNNHVVMVRPQKDNPKIFDVLIDGEMQKDAWFGEEMAMEMGKTIVDLKKEIGGGKERSSASMNMETAIQSFKRSGLNQAQINSLLRKSGFTDDEIKGGKKGNEDFLKSLEEGKENALKFNATTTAAAYDRLIEKEKKKLEKGGKVGEMPVVQVKEDVRFVGSHDGDTIKIDKDVPVKYRKSLIRHEHVEDEIMKEGIPYPIAHKIAQRYEKSTFPHGKKHWEKYSKIVNKIYHDNVKKGVKSFKS